MREYRKRDYVKVKQDAKNAYLRAYRKRQKADMISKRKKFLITIAERFLSPRTAKAFVKAGRLLRIREMELRRGTP